MSDGNLSIDQVRIVREAVYNNSAEVYSPDNSADRLLRIPQPLGELYKKHPAAVLDVLLSVMDGANPRDSALAAGYAFELLSGPSGGVICVEFFDKKTYDVLDKDWNATPRAHWIKKLRETRKKAEGEEKKGEEKGVGTRRS